MDQSYNSEAAKYQERLRLALKAAKICVFEVDIIHQLYTFFENSEDIFGVSGQTILADVQPYSKLSPSAYQKAVSDYFSHPDDFAVIDHAFQQVFQGRPVTYQARMRAAGSQFVWCKLDVTPVIEDQVVTRMIGVITDINHMKMRTDRLEQMAVLDAFTGLFNKSHALASIEALLQKYPHAQHALILSDIDNFKNFNDTYGHAVGDQIIRLVADTLKSISGKEDITGRFGGDEFILFVPFLSDTGLLEHKAQQLVRCENANHHCTNSIGISLFPQDASSAELLFRNADEALYHSKRTKAACTFYSELHTK